MCKQEIEWRKIKVEDDVRRWKRRKHQLVSVYYEQTMNDEDRINTGLANEKQDQKQVMGTIQNEYMIKVVV